MCKVLKGVLALIGDRFGVEGAFGVIKEEALLSITCFGFFEIEVLRDA